MRAFKPKPSTLSRFGHGPSKMSISAQAPRSVQPQLAVNTRGDIHEQAADRAADEVVRGPEASAIVHNFPRSTDGTLLSDSARAYFEPYFGHDFSQVRVYADTQADRSARALEAKAYTVGQNISFRSDLWSPGTPSGRWLIAHELAHVVQQSTGAVPPIVQRQSAPASPAPTPNRPTNAPPSAWSEADFTTYLAWALAIQRRPSTDPAGWKARESGRAAGYVPNQDAPAGEEGPIFAGKTENTREFESTERTEGDRATTIMAPSGAGFLTTSATVNLSDFSPNADLVVRAHSHVKLPGGLMSYEDATKFFSGSNTSAARVEFVFDRRVDLGAKPDKSVAGYIYTRDGGQSSYDLDPIFRAYYQPAVGDQAAQPLPPNSITPILEAFRAVDASARIYRFRASTASGLLLTPIK